MRPQLIILIALMAWLAPVAYRDLITLLKWRRRPLHKRLLDD